MSKYKDRRTYNTSNIIETPDWLGIVMVITFCVIVATMFVTLLSDGAIDPFDMTATSRTILYNEDKDKNADDREITVRDAMANLISYKDMPYNYTEELLENYSSFYGEFVVEKATKDSKGVYTLTSESKDIACTEYDTYVFKFRTKDINDINILKKGSEVEASGTLTNIVQGKVEYTYDSEKRYGTEYTIYISDESITKDGE